MKKKNIEYVYYDELHHSVKRMNASGIVIATHHVSSIEFYIKLFALMRKNENTNFIFLESEKEYQKITH